MRTAFAPREPPLLISPHKTSEFYGLSEYHGQYFALLKEHFTKSQVGYLCQEMNEGHEFTLEAPFVGKLECKASDDSYLVQRFEFLIIAQAPQKTFTYTACVEVPWGYSFAERSPAIFAGLLAGDRDLQFQLYRTVAGGSAEKEIIESIDVLHCEWREIFPSSTIDE